MTGPRLALVAIVKNEAGWIQSLLARHRELWDSALVVDTGSTDGTGEIARSLGAETISFAWCDDFAAARNAGLAAAQGEWALCLDADEQVAPADFPRLRAAMAGAPCCYLLPQRNYYDRPEHAEWQPVDGAYPEEEKGQTGFFLALNSKFFPLDRRIRFSGRVHEETVTAARRAGLPVRELAVVIHHYGYVKSAQVNEERNRYYARLAELKLAEMPTNSAALLERALALVQVGRAREALPLLERLDGASGSDSHVARGRVLLAKLRQEQGRSGEAEQVLDRALAGEPDWLFAWVEKARLLRGRGAWDELEEVLSRARARVGDHPLFRKEEVELLINRGRLVEAARAAEEVCRRFPQFPQYGEIAARCRRLVAGGEA